MDELNPVYAPQLNKFFKLPQCAGIIGGKPRKSFFFMGAQGPFIFYLDPHTVQPAVSLRAECDTKVPPPPPP